MVAVLHNIRSVYNVGSIFRTADALAVSRIYLMGFTPAPLDEFKRPRRDFAKAALGAEKSLNWEKAADTLEVLEKLRKQGKKIFAVEQDKNSVPYYSVKERDLDSVVLVLGSEVDGLNQEILSRADKVLEIPMFGRKESLNVAAAFGIVGYHLKFCS